MDVLTETLGQRPGKVIAVHLSYRSRAEQRGRTPAHASYFLKASSSLTGSGEVVRPEGTELLGYEGEIAVVIGRAARNVTPGEGWGHVGWVTAANDLGLHDLRYADKGSNVRSKSGDGYTPVGPALIEAGRLEEGAIGLRTWCDGELVQDDSTAGLLFGIGDLVADLSRFMTLEVGDVILTGTPAGASVAQPGQTIEVEVFSTTDPSVTTGRLVTRVVEGPALAPWGNPPKVDDQQRADAWGHDVAAQAGEPRFELTDDLRARLEKVAVATLSAQLRKLGYNEVSIDGVSPLVPGKKLVGRARTLRYLPYRKDQFAARGGGYNAQKRAIDTVGEGEVLVMDARRLDDAGTLGDILALRAKVRGAAGIITDGCVRDFRLVAELGLPVYAAGHHPAVLGRRHIPWETDVDIACGGALVQVGDVIVADDDGPIVIPPALVLQVLEAAEQQEAEEAFIAEMVAAGESVDGLYPLDPTWRARYDAWRSDKK
ncbi:fumarylacetoacetate hydrolase family protein [Tessaracoccus oleiagri]|uniref:2-keto-4-pentenoate hydratase/2-oxohepta-3-ene-1,7-dioic acid hydratase (Catechol pathway) n=1 Tax=Tessaracoccus oleiagri TaxID=686624 RepID=A0A1G9HD01_9ACTN|nr:fumarylacetoacetate hydrolase family protein [Tessaracoccus oleiagri]SDL10706.1 2-keto-4-pentenoate hydratase/2-oxohepta-3-ene-1,7-dioic acid hydratase (catechol pathway) [Tessaracoccus oleiagri]